MQREELNRARQDYQSAKATVPGKQQADAALQKFYKDVLPAEPGDRAQADLHPARAARQAGRTCSSSTAPTP